MKNKIIMTALAATLSVAACSAPWHHRECSAGYKNQTVTYGERAHSLSQSDVRQIQKSLREDGYYNGHIDGIWGSQTTQAVETYQALHQQRETGTLTADKLLHFGVHIENDEDYIVR